MFVFNKAKHVWQSILPLGTLERNETKVRMHWYSPEMSQRVNNDKVNYVSCECNHFNHGLSWFQLHCHHKKTLLNIQTPWWENCNNNKNKFSPSPKIVHMVVGYNKIFLTPPHVKKRSPLHLLIANIANRQFLRHERLIVQGIEHPTQELCFQQSLAWSQKNTK